MKHLGLLISAVVAAATSATAQDVAVRSGEHDGYTRLVFKVPPNTEWRLAQRRDGARLTVDLGGVTFRTGSVFSRLTTNRLESLSQAQPGDALDLEFGCECVASAFLYRGSMIVLDITPGEFLPPLLADIPPPMQQRPVNATTASDTNAQMSGLDLPLLERGLKDQLSTRFLQGADRKLLDLHLAPVGPRSSITSNEDPLLSGLSANIRLTTVLDDLQDVLNSEVLQLDLQKACISTSELGFSSWSTADPFATQVSVLRTALYHEFDTLDEDSALKLAKLYAYHGFGAEALAVLELTELVSDEADRIKAIARIVDETAVQNTSPFSGLQRCDSDAALWAVLSDNALAADADVEAIEQAYAGLPDHLRRRFGMQLSQILVEGNQLEAARRVIRSVKRIEESVSPSTTRAKAMIAAAEGNGAREEKLLTEVVTATEATPEAPVALARLVEKRWTERKTVSTQELELAASFSVEYRRSDLGPMMARTHAIALSLSQDFDPAFNIILALENGQDRDRAFNRHLHLLAERSDDVTFLQQTFHILQKEKTPPLTTDAAIALADRLATLGFADQAFALSNRTEDQTRRAERARLRARAAMLSERPHKALLELAKDDSDKARALRAQAMEVAQDFTGAAEVLQSLEQDEAANRLFWLAGLPGDTVDPTDGKYAILNRTTQSLIAPPERQLEKPLKDAQDLLENSETTRQQIAEMFNSINRE
ncbi:hypothetical protein [Ruegeria sp. HKCCD4332]|uniref:hypothetical protein n=1 Tax=Ruegeria sp. HKCCD4332 TaxID=2683021 RepID=UPI001491567E|nr:hypothetical protein [Ruegeria sp. HKCCD4332]NOD76267.1 hypothetical protein [Ruegeria sp. HKCCD4332]